MATYNTRKKTHEVISASEYLKRYKQNQKSVEGAKILLPSIGGHSFGGFLIKRDKPAYEVF